MTPTKHFFTLFFLYYCVSFSLQAQEKIPLIDLITNLEETFNVKFSYSVSDVNHIMVNTPNEANSLQDIIETLQATTVLNFKVLNERYITISTVNKTMSFCGILKSETDNFPLIGASVVVVNSTKGGITNAEGKFQLQDVRVNDSIVVSFLGYDTQVFKVSDFINSDGICKTIVMTEKNEALNEVVITRLLTTGLQKQINGSTVLNTKQFGILPGLTAPDVLQSIQALPGIESVNESIANINVRGGTHDQNLILWDGIKMYHSGHFFGLISAYNPNFTNKVVVTKNGTSSEFSNGVSSSINMFTKDKLEQDFAGGVGVDLINADAFFEIPISEKLGLHISGRRSFTDVFSSFTYDNYFKRSFQDSELAYNSDNISESERSSDFFFYDYTAKLLFDLNANHKFRATIIGISNNLDYTESYNNSANEIESKTSNLKQNDVGYGANWNAIWNGKLTTDVSAFYSQYNVDATDYKIETDQRLTKANEVLETGFKFKSHLKVNKHLSLLNGYQFNEVGILNETTVSTPSYDRTKKDVLLNHALFTELTYKKQGLFFKIGVRGNYFQKFSKNIIEPRLNVRQKLSNRFAIKLQGEFKNQSTNQIIDFQDGFLGVENRRWILANEKNIPISESKQVSLGFEFNNRNFVIDAEGFYKVVDGIIASSQGFYNNFQYLRAVGSYHSKGAEFLVNKMTNHYSAWLSYTYSINEYTFDSFTPSMFPNNVDIRHSVSLAFNYDILKNLKISLGGLWRTGQPYTKPVEGNETIERGSTVVVNYDVPNAENLDNFMRLDASMKYDFRMSDTVESLITVGIINFTNRKNSINKYYKVSSEDPDVAVQIDNKSLGLTPNLSFRIKF